MNGFVAGVLIWVLLNVVVALFIATGPKGEGSEGMQAWMGKMPWFLHAIVLFFWIAIDLVFSPGWLVGSWISFRTKK